MYDVCMIEVHQQCIRACPLKIFNYTLCRISCWST
uniref:Uncharacterized protein n=1 Tax=Anguilla anguilla TaxID=7936 RepID=A0A0E9SDD6_ANGAN